MLWRKKKATAEEFWAGLEEFKKETERRRQESDLQFKKEKQEYDLQFEKEKQETDRRIKYLRATGNSASITNKKNFEPKVFN